jgi:hypothetical protein
MRADGHAGQTGGVARALALAAGLVLLAPAAASAQSESCQNDFQKVMGPRVALIERINGFAKKRPTAAQACQTLRSLRAADLRLIKWMEDNKDWCQLPDELLTQAKSGTQNTVRAQNQACGAAAQQARQLRQLREQQAGGGGQPRAPAVGSGVRLPQGAL